MSDKSSFSGSNTRYPHERHHQRRQHTSDSILRHAATPGSATHYSRRDKSLTLTSTPSQSTSHHNPTHSSSGGRSRRRSTSPSVTLVSNLSAIRSNQTLPSIETLNRQLSVDIERTITRAGGSRAILRQGSKTSDGKRSQSSDKQPNDQPATTADLPMAELTKIEASSLPDTAGPSTTTIVVSKPSKKEDHA